MQSDDFDVIVSRNIQQFGLGIGISAIHQHRFARHIGKSDVADEGIRRIRRMIIYDRWGSTVFERKHFTLPDSNASWDGTNVATGVFVWMPEIEKTDDSVEVLSGDVFVGR